MKNSMGIEFHPQRKSVRFTPLHGKKLKCNECREKVTRKGVNGHEASHRKVVQRSEIDIIKEKVNTILLELTTSKTRVVEYQAFINIINDLNIPKRVTKIIDRFKKLSDGGKIQVSGHIEKLDKLANNNYGYYG